MDGLNFNIVGRNLPRMYSSLSVGQVYMTEGPLSSSYRPEDVFQVQQDTNGRVRALTLTNGSGAVFILHTNKPPFDDPRVRRALYLGIDREEAKQILYCQNDYGKCFGRANFYGVGSIGGQSVEPMEELAQRPGYGPSADRAEDYAEAKRLLADAGYPDGVQVTLNIGQAPLSLNQTQIFNEQLRKNVGIDVSD